jgi:hypothetical protein
MNTLMHRLLMFSAIMFAVGIALPMLVSSLNWPAGLWNFLQIGGLVGLVVFGAAYLMTKPKKQ